MKKTNPNYKDNPNPKVNPQNFNKEINKQYKRRIFKFKVVIGTICAIIVALLATYGILYLNKVNVFFFEHFCMPIVLMLVGIVAFLLPLTNQKRISGDNKGDNIMVVASVLSFILAIITIFMSFQ